MIMRNMTCNDKLVLLPLYKALIRPVLEYGNVVWSPYHKKYITLIENVQRHFTKRILGMKNLTYEERLENLKLPSLVYRRMRGDLIEVFKILNNIYDKVTTNSIFTLDHTNRTRAHNYKLTKNRVNSKKFQNFFSNRIINRWNKLPEAIVNSDSLNMFKSGLDRHYRKYQYSTSIVHD